MKFSGIILLILLPFQLFAQRLNGLVIDKVTNLPVVYANVTAPNSSEITSYSGQFTLNKLRRGDTIMITCVGYKPYKIAYNKVKTDTLIVFLRQSSIMLKDVNVKARHNFKLDSINLRKQYADIFNYKGPTFADMFITVDPYVYVPYNNIHELDGTATLFTVDVLSVVNLLTKNKAPESKLQKTLLQDEENTYVDQRFSKEKITEVTKLQGDTLLDFMADYRPTISQTKKMTDYQMILYIKKSYAEFTKSYKYGQLSPFSK